ncbi:MAG: hypothetical protein ABI383_12845 [Acidobacteriaceae bacterium]
MSLKLAAMFNEEKKDGRVRAGSQPAAYHAGAAKPTLHKIIFLLGLALVLSAAPLLLHAFADNSAPPPAITINTSAAQPRPLEDATTQSVARVYSQAWTDLDRALTRNDASALNAAFVGFANARYAAQIKQQLKAGMTVHLIAHSHNASAVFYGIEGASLEIRDDVQLERQVLAKGKIIASETKTIPFVAILTVVDNGWKVRVLEEAQQ